MEWTVTFRAHWFTNLWKHHVRKKYQEQLSAFKTTSCLFLANLCRKRKVSFCDHPLSVIHHCRLVSPSVNNFIQTTSPPKPMNQIQNNFTGMFLVFPFLARLLKKTRAIVMTLAMAAAWLAHTIQKLFKNQYGVCASIDIWNCFCPYFVTTLSLLLK